MAVLRRVAAATLIAGTLDIIAAVVLTLLHGGKVAAMLRYIASGPVPAATGWGAGGAALGLAVHYALIAAMAAAFVWAADALPRLKAAPMPWGALYGVALWAVMNLLVVPLRFGTPPPSSATTIAIQLFCHVVLVGIPIALAARRGAAGPPMPHP